MKKGKALSLGENWELDNTYWKRHASIAIGIMFGVTMLAYFLPHKHVFAGMLAGSIFYLSREIRDYEKSEPKGEWDVPGLVWGTVPPLVVYVTYAVFVWLRERKRR